MAKLRRILAVTSVLALGGAALAGGIVASRILGKVGGGKIGVTEWYTLYKNPREFFPNKNRVNVVLIGKDYNRDSKGMPYTKGARADSIMLLSLDLDRKTVSALSVPRDTWVHAPDGRTGKINATYARGGPELLSETIGELLGTAPEYYIALKPDAVKAIVDELGGVEVETLDAMEYNDWWGKLFVKLPAGRQHINGEQAIGFTRFREADIYQRNPDGSPVLGRSGLPLRKRSSEIVHSKEEGDPRRIARQQQLIRAMIAEGKKPQNLLQADEVINVALKQIDTNLEPKQIFALAALFRDTQQDQMQSAQLVGRGRVRGTYRFEPDREKMHALADWLLRGNEQAAKSLTIVDVQNGTKVAGAARTIAGLLQKEGYDARNAGNAPRPKSDEAASAGNNEHGVTVVTYRKAAVAPRAQQIAELLGAGAPVKDTTPGAAADTDDEEAPADVTVLLGRDVTTRLATQRSAKL